MGRHSYIGGSTVIRPGSDWFGGRLEPKTQITGKQGAQAKDLAEPHSRVEKKGLLAMEAELYRQRNGRAVVRPAEPAIKTKMTCQNETRREQRIRARMLKLQKGVAVKHHRQKRKMGPSGDAKTRPK